MICGICKLSVGSEAYESYIQAKSLLSCDQVDGAFPHYKQLRSLVHRMMAKGCVNDMSCAHIDDLSCFCGIFNVYLQLKPRVQNNKVVLCECCRLADNESVQNILLMVRQQLEAVDGRVNSPQISKMTRKVNVLQNAIRQCKKWSEEICCCTKHDHDVVCVCSMTKLVKAYRDTIDFGVVIGCAGVEQMQETKNTNVTFVDQREQVEDQGFTGGDVTESHRGIAMSESAWSVMSLLKRPTPVFQTAWKVDETSEIAKLSIPGDLIKGVFSNVFDMFNYFRGSVVLRIQVNGTKFHVGKLAVYLLPFPRTSAEGDLISINNIPSLPHVFLDASIANSGILRIPFSHMLSYFNSTEADSDQRLGVVFFVPFNVLRVATGGSPQLSVSVWAHFEDVELHQPFAHSQLLPKGGLPSAAMNVVNDVSNVARGVVSAYNLVSNLDKPIDASTYARYVPTAISDVTHGVGLDKSIRMGLLPKATVTSAPAMMGSVDSDMSVLTLCQLQTRIATIEWTKDHPVGKVLWQCPVAPTVYTSKAGGTGYDKYILTNLAYCARAFCFWRGGIQYTFDIASSIMHSGRLAFVYVAGSYARSGVTLESIINGGMLICDLQEGKSFSATVPYMSSRPWMRCDKIVSASEEPSRNMATGMVYLMVLNNLAIPTGVPTSVNVNILVGASSDFELSVPCDLTGFLSNNAVPPLSITFKGSVTPRQELPRSAANTVVRTGEIKPIQKENIVYDRDGQPLEIRESVVAAPRVARADSLPNGMVRKPTSFYNDDEYSTHTFVLSTLVYKLEVQDSRLWYDMRTGEYWSYDVNVIKHKVYQPPFGTHSEDYHVPRSIVSKTVLTRLIRDKRWTASLSYDYFFLVDPKYPYWFSFKSRGVKNININHVVSIGTEANHEGLLVYLSHLCGTNEVISRSVMSQILSDSILGAAGVKHVGDGRKTDQGSVLALGDEKLKIVTSLTTSENAMDLQTVLRRQYPLALMKLTIENTNIKNIPYIVIPVSPVVQRSNRQLLSTVIDAKRAEVNEVIGAENYSHVHHFAGMFTFWRGSMRYKFLFGQSVADDATVVVVFRPNVASSVEYGKVHYCKAENFISSMDFASVLYQGRLQASIEVEVPYTSTYNQLAIYHPITNGVYDLRSSCGVVQVYFLGLKDSLTQHVLVTAALGDDAIFSYLRAAPPLYIRKDIEAKRSVADDAEIQDFSLGTLVFPTSVPLGAMGLYDLYKKTSDIVGKLHGKLPHLEGLTESLSEVTNKVSNLLDNLGLGAESAFLIFDVMAITNACVLLMRAEGYEKVVHIVHIIGIIAIRFGVSIALSNVASFVMQCWEYVKGWWPQVRNTPMGSSGTGVNPFVPICAAVIGLVCNKALPSTSLKSVCKDLVPCFRLFNDGIRTGETIVSWIVPFIDVLKKYAAEALVGAFPGLAPWMRITDKIGEITAWMHDIDGIDEEYVPRLAANDPGYKNMIFKLRDKAMEYTGHIAKGDDRHIASMVREYARKIIKISNELNVMMDTPSSRVDPFSVCLVGNAGVGKSALVPLLAHNLMDRLGYAKYNRMYARNSTDQFWSRYKGETCVVLDDYDQHTDAPAIRELIDIKTNNVYQLNHATESKKGLLFTSELLIMTTNTEYPTRNYISNTLAWWRRRNILIEVVRNNLDEDFENYSHLWFRILHSSEPNTDRGPIMSLEELKNAIFDRAQFYLDAQYALVRRNEELANCDRDETFSDAVGAAAVKLRLDMDLIMAHDVYRAFDDGMFECVRCLRDGRQYVWSCETQDEYLLSEWDSFRGMFSNLTQELRKYLKAEFSERIVTWKNLCLEKMEHVWQVIKLHPGLVSLPIATGLFLAWRYYVRSQPKLFMGMTAVYNIAHNAYQQKVVFAATDELDPQCNDLIQKRVLPYVYRVRVHSEKLSGSAYEQNCFAVGRRWIVTARHVFSEKFQNVHDGDLSIDLLYGGQWMNFLIHKEEWRVVDKYDLIFLNLDARFHEHRTNIGHFVDESDLGKLVHFDAVYVGAECAEEKKVEHVRAKPLPSLLYMDPIKGNEIHIYKAWKYLGASQPSTCGGVLLANTSKIRGKIIGIHVAAGHGYGYSHVVTRQIVEKFIGSLTPCLGIVVPETIGPLPNTFPMGHFGYIGIAKQSVGAVNRTELTKSLIHGDVGAVNTAPSALSSKDKRLVVPCSPMYNAIMKLGDPSCGFEQKLVNYILNGITNRFSILDKKYARLLTEHESVIGIAGIEHVDRINMATSAGLPYVKEPLAKKGKLWLLTDDFNIANPLLRKRLEERESMAKTGNRIESVWIDCLKDEKRPIEKVSQGNTRLFQIPPLDFTLLFRKYFLGFIAAKMEKRQHLASQVGIDPYGPDWTALHERLTAFSPYMYCGDYKNFDKSTLPQVMRAYATAANRFYGDEEDSEAACVRYTLVEELVHTVHIAIDKVYVSHHGNPSGNPGTTDMNGFVNEFYLVFAWVVAHIAVEAEPTTVNEFYNNVLPIVFGDDNVIAVKREATKIYNPDSIAKILKDCIGVTYTNASKDGAGGAFVGIDDVVFLKNKFVARENDPFRKWAALDRNTIREMCNWVRGGMAVEEMTLENVQNSCRFAYFHGREFYKDWSVKVQNALLKKDVMWTPPSFDCFDLWFLAKFENDV